MIERRTKVVESCKEIVRAALEHYEPADVALVDALPGTEFSGKLDQTLVAAGYIFDDGGRQGETGSDLVKYMWTIEYMVMATTGQWGKNVTDAVAAAFTIGENIPLLSIGEAGTPTGETVIVDYSQAQRVVVRAPRPWEENIWMTRVKLEDYYYSSKP